jgi:hypothetical protein
MFPLSLKGKVSVATRGGVSVEAVDREITEFLRGVGLRGIVLGPGAVQFRNNTTLMWSFQIYVMASGGVFNITTDATRISVSYEIRVTRLLAISVFPTLFMALVCFSASNLDLFDKLLIIIGVWLWLFGVNYILIWARTRAFLRRSLRKFTA